MLKDKLRAGEEQAFLDHLVRQYRSDGVNGEARALFRAIQAAMTKGGLIGDELTLDSYLVSNLAACAIVALAYDEEEVIPWERSDHDFVLTRTFNGFIRSLVTITRARATHPKFWREDREGNCYIGLLELPKWFPAWADSWAR